MSNATTYFPVYPLTLKNARNARVQAYAALDLAQTRGETDTGIARREQDIQEAEDIGWTLYSGDNDPAPHETRLLIAHTAMIRGSFISTSHRDEALECFKNARYFVSDALKEKPDHTASLRFKIVVEDAIAAEQPIEPSSPTLPEMPSRNPRKRSKNNGTRPRFNHTANGRPVAAITQTAETLEPHDRDASAQRQRWKELAADPTTDPNIAEIMEKFQVSPAQAERLATLDV